MRRLTFQFVPAICAMLGAFSIAAAGPRAQDSPQGQAQNGSGHGFDGGLPIQSHDVCASGDRPLVDFGPSQLDFAVASGVSFLPIGEGIALLRKRRTRPRGW